MLFVFHPLHLFALPWMLKKVINQKKKQVYGDKSCRFNTFYIALGVYTAEI